MSWVIYLLAFLCALCASAAIWSGRLALYRRGRAASGPPGPRPPCPKPPWHTQEEWDKWLEVKYPLVEIISADRPTTAAEEDRVLLERFRGALERISVALGMPGSPDLAVDVPAEVEAVLLEVKERR